MTAPCVAIGRRDFAHRRRDPGAVALCGLPVVLVDVDDEDPSEPARESEARAAAKLPPCPSCAALDAAS